MDIFALCTFKDDTTKIIEYCKNVMKEAELSFQKKNFKRSIELYEILLSLGIDKLGCLTNLG